VKSYLILWITGSLIYAQEKPDFKFHGLKIYVHDLKLAEEFYCNQFHFRSTKNGNNLKLETDSWPIYIEKANGKAQTSYPFKARTGLTVQTYKLLPRIDKLRKSGVVLYDTLLRRNGVGISIPFQDPSGNVLSMIEVQIREIERFDGVRIYNTGVTISDMDAAIEFYERILGFEEWSRN